MRVGDRTATADEPQAVGLIRDFSDVRAVHGHQMKHPGGVLALGARPARAENRPLPAENLGLNKEIAERRMQRIRGRRGEDDLRITRDVNGSAFPGTVDDGDAAQLDVILGRNGNFRMRVEVVVAATELRFRLREDRFIRIRLFERRLIGR